MGGTGLVSDNGRDGTPRQPGGLRDGVSGL